MHPPSQPRIVLTVVDVYALRVTEPSAPVMVVVPVTGLVVIRVLVDCVPPGDVMAAVALEDVIAAVTPTAVGTPLSPRLAPRLPSTADPALGETPLAVADTALEAMFPLLVEVTPGATTGLPVAVRVGVTLSVLAETTPGALDSETVSLPVGAAAGAARVE